MLLLVLTQNAQAATLVVDTTGPYASISDAVAAASDGDTIEVASGRWYDCVDLAGKSLAIVGTAGSAATTIDAAGTCPTVIASTSGAPDVALTGFTISNSGASGILLDGGTYTLSDLAFSDIGTPTGDYYALEVDSGSASLSEGTFDATVVTGGDSVRLTAGELTLDNVQATGGVVVGATGGTLTLNDCAFDDAQVSGEAAVLTIDGGTFANAASAVSVSDSTLTVTSATFEDNSAFNGGAINAEDSTVSLVDATFARNAGLFKGGAVYAAGSSLDIVSCAFTDNQVVYSYNANYGGAVYTDGNVTDAGSTWSGNEAGTTRAGSNGAALYAGGDIEVTGSTFTNNVAVFGKGGAMEGDNVTVTSCTFSGNSAYDAASIRAAFEVQIESSTFSGEVLSSSFGTGGAVEARSVVVRSSSFESCGSGAYGGAIAVTAASTVSDSEFSSCSASNRGGAIYLDSSSATLTVSGCTFDGNSGGIGGAIYAEDVSIDDTWFLENSAAYGGAVYAIGDATTSNSYWCGNSAATPYEGGALYADSVTSSNSIWARNSAEDGGAIYVRGPDGTLSLTNDTLVGNSADSNGGAVYLKDCGSTSNTILNTIFAFTLSGDAVYSADASCSSSTTYTNFYDNLAADAGGSYTFAAGGFGNLAVDPGLASFPSAGDCDTDGYGLAAGSAMVDAGKTTILDVDGSRSDMGATGGPASAWTDADADGSLAGMDCDDADAAAYPGATEACDGADNDCDGTADEGVGSDWYADTDGDGYGDPAGVTVACAAPAGSVADGTDCDDGDAAVSPGGVEACNGTDDDCDGAVDEGVTSTYSADADEDGFGDPTVSTAACAAPAGYTADASDCDDAEASTSPGGTELCDGVDNDCDGVTDDEAAGAPSWYADADGDGFGDPTVSTAACSAPTGHVSEGTDCNDTEAGTWPGAPETCGDGVDQDCDGADTSCPDTGDTGDTDDTGDTEPDPDTGDTAADTDTGDTDTGDTGREDTDAADSASAEPAEEDGDGCGCSTPTGTGLAPALGALVLLVSRRRQ